MGKAIWTEAFPEQVKGHGQKKGPKWIKRNKRPNPISAAGKARNEKYRKLREEWIKGKKCEAHVKGCKGKAEEVHHKRGRRGSLLFNLLYWLPVCSNCHRWIHDNILKARRAKLICEPGQWNKE